MGTAQAGRTGDVVDAIRRLSDAANGRPPSIRELSADLSISTTRVRQYLERLEREGRIAKRPARESRSVILTGTAA